MITRALVFTAALTLSPLARAADPDFNALAADFRQTLTTLVAADTSNLPGNETRATKIIGEKLTSAGVPFQTMEFAPGRGNLVARLKGTGGKRPLLLLAHLDVVGADHQNWSSPPHTVTEKDGFLVGRGVQDDLGDAVANLEIFLALKASGEKLDRDVIYAVTGDEESGGLGVQAMLKEHPEWIDAEFAFNEGGAPILDEAGHVRFVSYSVTEKIYRDFRIVAKGQTGHSSVPKGDNAIQLLSAAIDRLAHEKAHYRLLPATRAYLAARADLEVGELKQAMKKASAAKGEIPAGALKVLLKNPTIEANLHTTCIPTLLHGGTRANALPSEASVNINCRILPDEDPEQIRLHLEKIVNDKRLVVEGEDVQGGGGSSPVDGPIPKLIRATVEKIWPGKITLPSMMLGATDSKYLRPKGIEAYNISPIQMTEEDRSRAHGVDERIPLAKIPEALKFWWELVRAVAR